MAGPSVMNQAGPPCPTCGYQADPEAEPVHFCPKCGQDLGSGAAEPTSTTALLGMVVADRYKLIAHLGEGGMGSVYKAEHVRMGKALAVKVLRGSFARDPSAVERFRSEARIVSRLSHPNTIAVFDFGEIAATGGFYLAMEYVPGRDLARVLREEGPLPEARVADIGQQILGSLAEAHEAGIIHRDMKPGNVMLTQTRPGEDFAKVLDFGIAKWRDDVSASQTGTGAIVGTPSYLAPEQARGQPLDARADLYAVGCLLYELLCGHAPFAGRAPMATVNAHLHDPVPSLAAAAPGISRRLVELVHRALAKRPDDRFPSADAMRSALLALGEPTRPGAGGRPQVTGELEIASREDFREFERTHPDLRRGRSSAPAWIAAALLAAGAVAWRWGDVHAFLAAQAPGLAAQLPAALRPAERFDGEEREPDDAPARATPLPVPPGAAGDPAGGAVAVRGTVGARLDPRTGDVDVFRIEVPAAGRRQLVARWHAEGGDGGIRGLDVVLALHRAPDVGASAERASAPLIAAVDRGGPGAAEGLEAPVEGGTYFLSVREHHDEATGPVEKPTDRYRLEVRLRPILPGEATEPDDAPETAGARAGRYPDWRSMAERNPLAGGEALRGELLAGDADTFLVRGDGPAAIVVARPGPALALALEAWAPEPADLEEGAPERGRLDPVLEGEAGAPLVAEIRVAELAPSLVRLRGADGEGAYTVCALAGPHAPDRAVPLVRELGRAGKIAPALELAAAVLRSAPRTAGRADLAELAGGLAGEAAPGLSPADLPQFDRASRLLGEPVLHEEGGSVRYRGAFERRR